MIVFNIIILLFLLVPVDCNVYYSYIRLLFLLLSVLVFCLSMHASIAASDAGGRGIAVGLAFTRYCHYEYCMVHGIQKAGRGCVLYCAIDVQQYCNSVGNVDEREE